MEEGCVKCESFTVQITPEAGLLSLEVYDNNDPDSMPIMATWGYTREHLLRRFIHMMMEGKANGYV